MNAPQKTGESRLLDAIQAVPVIPVIVLQSADDAIPVAEALLAGGISTFEVTMRTEASLPAIEKITQRFPTALTGVGTVLDAAQARQAIAAGSQFMVSPGLDERIVEIARAARVPFIPGVATATEVQRALNLGLRILKFFPAGAAGGIATLKAFASVFSEAGFVPTGGVSAGNLADYLRVPNVVACGGSWLTPRGLVAHGRFDSITRLAMEAREVASQARGEVANQAQTGTAS